MSSNLNNETPNSSGANFSEKQALGGKQNKEATLIEPPTPKCSLHTSTLFM